MLDLCTLFHETIEYRTRATCGFIARILEVSPKFVHRSNIVQEDFKGIRNPALLSYSP
jgi:hypothetical protein